MAMVSETALHPAADDDYLRELGIERLNQLGYAIQTRIIGVVSDALTLSKTNGWLGHGT
jgi:hypothetical protein